MKPDARLKVRFLTTEEGGRETAIHGDKYGCPVIFGGNKAFDCRFVLSGQELFELGKVYEIQVKFLNPELAIKEFQRGVEVSLWEGRIIAEGKVIEFL